MKPTMIIGIIVSILAIAGSLCGAVYFLEDRYVNEKEVVVSLQQQQQVTDLHLLELWRDRLSSLREICRDNSNNCYKDRVERAQQNIRLIENRLFHKDN